MRLALRILVLGAVSSLMLAQAGFGGCGAGTTPSGNGDLGTDMRFPAADMGFAGSDLGFESATLVMPIPLSSNNALDTTFTFDIVTNTPPEIFQQQITIKKHGSVTPLGGAFSWKPQAGGLQKLTFIPTAPLEDGTDYVVKVGTLLKTGVTAGSKPKVIGAYLQGGTGAHVKIKFSEPVKPQTVTVKLTINGVVRAGTVAATSAANEEFKFTLDPGVTSGDAFFVVDSTVQAATGAGLDVTPFDSNTENLDGSFEWDIGTVDLATSASHSWQPTIN